jgi:predicted transcriptional regulator
LEKIGGLSASPIKSKVLFIDTLAKNFGAGNENDTKDMNTFCTNVLNISEKLGLATIIIHHSGKDLTKGARGSIALTGAVDLSIEMSRSDPETLSPVMVRCRKQKDAAEFRPFMANPQVVEKSLVLDYDGDAKPQEEAKKEITVYDLLPVLKAVPPEAALSVAEVMRATGMAQRTAYRYLDILAGQSLLEKITGRPNRYKITAGGIEAIAKYGEVLATCQTGHLASGKLANSQYSVLPPLPNA